MIKKLKLYICLAAVLLTGVQAVMAQVSESDPASPMNKATNGRFVTDVDRFFSVTDWADIDMSKFLGYLKADDIAIPTTGGTFNDSATSPDPKWEGGLALKVKEIYLSAFYNGYFTAGTQNEGQVTTTYDSSGNLTISGPSFITVNTAAGITNRNYFGVLVGYRGMGFRFSVVDNLQTVDVPHMTIATADTAATFFDTADVGATGWFRKRSNDITPKLAWGMTTPISVGKFAIKPSADLALRIDFSEMEWELTRMDGSIYHYEDMGANSLTPTLHVNSGNITLWQGDWGRLAVAADDWVSVLIAGEGGYSVPWINTLRPYATWSMGVENLKVAARFRAPLQFGYNGATGHFSFGRAYALEAAYGAAGAAAEHPDILTGFQYTFTNGGLLGDWVDKLRLDNKLVLSAGVKVFLPRYSYTENFSETTSTGNYQLQTTSTKSHTWTRPENYQNFTSGLALYFTPNIVLDMSTDYIFSEPNDNASWFNWIPVQNVMFSIKY